MSLGKVLGASVVLVSGLTKPCFGRALGKGAARWPGIAMRSMHAGLHRPKAVLTKKKTNFFCKDEGKDYCQYPPICGFVYKYLFSVVNSAKCAEALGTLM